MVYALPDLGNIYFMSSRIFTMGGLAKRDGTRLLFLFFFLNIKGYKGKLMNCIFNIVRANKFQVLNFWDMWYIWFCDILYCVMLLSEGI